MLKKDQNVLLNEMGMLIETKVSKTRSKQMKNLKVFATTKLAHEGSRIGSLGATHSLNQRLP